MKHATSKAFNSVEFLLEKLRNFSAIREKKKGVFYKGSKAFIHFHEDPNGIYADLHEGKEWSRWPVNNREEMRNFLNAVECNLSK